MNPNYYDIIIIGSGIAGLYSAYNIKKNGSVAEAVTKCFKEPQL